MFLLVAESGAASGKIEKGVYRSKGGLFELPVPYPSERMHLKDASGKFEQAVSFEVEYAYSHRVERFKAGSELFAVADKSLPMNERLAKIESEIFRKYADAGFKTISVVRREFVEKGDQIMLQQIRELGASEVQNTRGVIIFLTPNYVNVLHFSHPMTGKDRADDIWKEIGRLYDSLRLIDR